MNDLENHKRTRKNMLDMKKTAGRNKTGGAAHLKKHYGDFPKSVLDIIEADYPERYALILEDAAHIESMFSKEEWTDILTKSRNSYESHIERLKRQSDL